LQFVETKLFFFNSDRFKKAKANDFNETMLDVFKHRFLSANKDPVNSYPR